MSEVNTQRREDVGPVKLGAKDAELVREAARFFAEREDRSEDPILGRALQEQAAKWGKASQLATASKDAA